VDISEKPTEMADWSLKHYKLKIENLKWFCPNTTGLFTPPEFHISMVNGDFSFFVMLSLNGFLKLTFAQTFVDVNFLFISCEKTGWTGWLWPRCDEEAIEILSNGLY
jgi:hypothetical protein